MSNKQSSRFAYGDKVTILSPFYRKVIAHGTIERETIKCGTVLVRTSSIDLMEFGKFVRINIKETYEVPVKILVVNHVPFSK